MPSAGSACFECNCLARHCCPTCSLHRAAFSRHAVICVFPPACPTDEPSDHVDTQSYRAFRSYYQPRRQLKPPTTRGASAALPVCTARRRSPRSKRAHVAVIGIGGVGSWVAEALARSAVGSADADRSRQRRREQHEPADPRARRQLRQAEGRGDGGAHRADQSAVRRAAGRGLHRAGQLRGGARRRLRLRDRCDRQRAHQDRADRVVRRAASSR